MTIDLTELLRLEIERDPDVGELINLVANPDGALGAWGWVTPVAGSTLRAFVGLGLTYTSPGGVDSYFYTEPMAVSAGGFVAASWVGVQVAGAYTARVEWLDASKTKTGATAATPMYEASAIVRTIGSQAVPAGAVYCRLRFDHFTSTGGQPPAPTGMTVTAVTLTESATAAGLVWQRTNLMPTPTGASGVGNWAAYGDANVGRTAAVALDGAASLKITKHGDTGAARLSSELMAVRSGRDYAIQVRLRPANKARKVTVAVRWMKDNGDLISITPVKTVTETIDAWTDVVGRVLTAPSHAAQMRVRIEYDKLVDGEIHYVNKVMVEQASAVSTYFDGASTPVAGETYTWAGTPYESASIATAAVGDVGTLVPVPYQNILGPTSHINVDREGLNVGSMSLTLFDAILDPTQNDLIRQGRRIRLTSVDGDVMFAGKVLTGAVTYHLLATDEHKRAEVNLTAVDPINTVAATPRNEGVATIAELPYVLEGAGVPWSCNGSGDQVPTATVVAYNDNASVLDQVAVTRNSVLGYAWVDRNGVLQAWDSDQISTAVAATLDETSYNADLDIAFDLDKVINSVTVRVARVISTTGATEELVFGPYVDQDSYAKYGEHAAEYAVQGFDAADAAGIQAYAQKILDANATPSLRVNTMTLPIRSADDLGKAKLDLYDLVSMTNARAGLDETSRVTTVQHDITPGKWLVTLGFTVEGAVAAPVSTPTPPPSVGKVVDEVKGGYTGSLQDIYDTANAKADKAYVDATASTMAQQAANGKNTVWYSANPPGSTANTVGDIWFQKDVATQTVIAQWIGAGGYSWTSTQVGNAVIANLDAGKLTVGSAFTNALWVKTTLTLGDASYNGIIQSYNFANSSVGVLIDKNGLVAKGGTITGAVINGSEFHQDTVGRAAAVDIDSNGFTVTSYQGITLIETSAGHVRIDGFLELSSTGYAIDAVGTIHTTRNVNAGTDVTAGGKIVATGATHGNTLWSDVDAGAASSSGADMGPDGKIKRSGTSSRTIKDNIVPLPFDQAAFLSVDAVSYTLKDEAALPQPKTYAGFILEDVVARGLDLWVWNGAGDTPGGLFYERWTVGLHKVAQDHEGRIAALEAENTDLKAQLAALADRVGALEQPTA